MTRSSLYFSCLSLFALTASGCSLSLSPPGKGSPAQGGSTATSAVTSGSKTSGKETKTGSSGSASATASNSSSSSASSSGTLTSTGTEEPSLVSCNPGREDQCDAGQKCSTYMSDLTKKQTDGTRCAPVTGTAKLGEACTRNRDEGTDDCGPMLFCNAGCSACDGPGTCIAYCDVDKDPVQDCKDRGVENGHCFHFNGNALPICMKVCDPIKQDCADEKQACHATLDNFLCATFRPEPGSEGKYGQPCDRVQSCAPGLTCRDAKEVEACKDQEEGRCCTNICDRSKKDEKQCGGEQESCEAIFEKPVTGLEDVGVCVLPKSEDGGTTGTDTGTDTGSTNTGTETTTDKSTDTTTTKEEKTGT